MFLTSRYYIAPHLVHAQIALFIYAFYKGICEYTSHVTYLSTNLDVNTMQIHIS
jgi:hypothetical protein